MKNNFTIEEQRIIIKHLPSSYRKLHKYIGILSIHNDGIICIQNDRRLDTLRVNNIDNIISSLRELKINKILNGTI